MSSVIPQAIEWSMLQQDAYVDFIDQSLARFDRRLSDER